MSQQSRKNHPGAVKFEFVHFWEFVIGPFTSHFSSMLKEAFGLDYFIASLDFDGQESKDGFITTFDNIKTDSGFGVIFFNLFCKFFLPIVAFSLVLGPKHFIYPTSSK